MRKKINKIMFKFFKYIALKFNDNTRVIVYREILKILSKHTKNSEDDLIALIFARGIEQLKKEKKIETSKIENAFNEINENQIVLKDILIDNKKGQAVKFISNKLLDLTPLGRIVEI